VVPGDYDEQQGIFITVEILDLMVTSHKSGQKPDFSLSEPKFLIL
jgi:hypothetical protein